ncbi:MAG: UDP-N-acetylmuramoyl-L-alanine--D-glutamate ligase [Kiritimatiellae bacterium]|nr:UDP-N-acetylmuramoyl-L-alanine--D-glutamate ligase [Kiritimatiellia bacterium]
MKNNNYNNALVLGMGVSGVAATKLLLGKKCSVVVVDRGDADSLRDKGEELVILGADVQLGVEDLSSLLLNDFDICVISPGIASDDIWLDALKQKQIKIISELELGASYLQLPMVAVTGSNGKSTFVKLCGDMFAQNGVNAVLAGNYGKPLCEVAMEQDAYDWAVVEVSSFQLEYVVDFHPDIAVVINVEPDHLDRHGNMENYIGVKSRIFDCMLGDNLALVHDEVLDKVRECSAGKPLWTSFGCHQAADYHYCSGGVEYNDLTTGAVASYSLKGTTFDNEITGLTAAAVFAVSEYLKLDRDKFRGALVEFESLPHRVEMVGEHQGVMFVDDSKATNIAALIGALKMMKKPVRLIVGGQLKEKDISKPQEFFGDRVVAVYCIGESGEMFYEEWESLIKCYMCGDLKKAIDQAWKDSEPGEVILLAPGCASFDQFCNYKERGMQFQEVVHSIMGLNV